jgi:hypothetical protein
MTIPRRRNNNAKARAGLLLNRSPLLYIFSTPNGSKKIFSGEVEDLPAEILPRDAIKSFSAYRSERNKSG